MLTGANLRAHFKAYNPNQKRYPKGDPKGGQWRSSRTLANALSGKLSQERPATGSVAKFGTEGRIVSKGGSGRPAVYEVDKIIPDAFWPKSPNSLIFWPHSSKLYISNDHESIEDSAPGHLGLSISEFLNKSIRLWTGVRGKKEINLSTGNINGDGPDYWKQVYSVLKHLLKVGFDATTEVIMYAPNPADDVTILLGPIPSAYKAYEAHHSGSGMQLRGRHGVFTQMMKRKHGKRTTKPIAMMAVKAYDPGQKRYPKGHPKGGQWRQAGPSGSVGESLRFVYKKDFRNLADWLKGYMSPSQGVKMDAAEQKKFHETRRGIQIGARAVDQTLKLSKTPVRTFGKQGLIVDLAKQSFHGEYKPKSNHILISTNTPEPAASFVHEMGHLIDYAVFGKGPQQQMTSALFHPWDSYLGSFAVDRQANSKGNKWWNAVTRSAGYKKLTDAMAIGHYLNKKGHKIGLFWQYGNYLGRPAELFARAFTQYVAKKSRSPVLMSHINRGLKKALREYWDWNDFEKIAREFDDLFGSQNLLKEFNAAQARWPKGSPRGGEWKSKVGGGLFTGGKQKIAREVVRAAEKLHGPLPAHTITITRRLGPHRMADYQNGRIRVSTRSRTPALDTAHELGHLVDHRGLGSAFPSVNDRRLAGFRKAVDRSATTKKWKLWSAIGHIALGGNRYFVNRSVFRHVLDRREQFARAYAQHLARKSRGRLWRNLRIAQKSPVSYYWSDREFRPIARELDRLFNQ